MIDEEIYLRRVVHTKGLGIRMKTLKYISLFLILLIFIIGIILLMLSSFVDRSFVNVYVFRFDVLNQAGQPLPDVSVDVKGNKEGNEFNIEYAISKTNHDFQVEYQYEYFTSAIGSLPPQEELAFSFTIRRQGFVKQSATFSMKELREHYLTGSVTDKEPVRDFYYFTLPDFILEIEREEVISTNQR